MNYSTLQNNTLLIIPNNIKKDVLINLSKINLLNIKIMTLDELIKKITFDYDDSTIKYLMDNYNIKYNIALTYIKNMYYIEDTNYNSNKLNELKNMKKDLINNNMFIYDSLFLNYLKQKEIVVFGYDYISKYNTKILNKIKNVCNIKIIEKEKKVNKDYTIYEFDNIDEEIEFVILEIIKLLESGININNIKLANINDEYNLSLKKMFEFYKMPLFIKSNISLYETLIGNKFLQLCKTHETLEDVLNNLITNFNLEDSENNNLYNQIIDICNSLNFDKLDNNTIEILKNKLKTVSVKTNKMDNCIEIINLKDNVISDDKYVFLMNFNQNTIPVIYKDEDYISDNLKNEIDIETTLEKNIREKDNAINIINRINNLVITYKLKSPFETYYPSTLVGELNASVRRVNNDITKSYSNIYNKIKLTKKLDKLVKYGTIDEDLNILYNTYNDIDYLSYNNKFNKIDSKNLEEYLNNKLLLSYSSIDKFYRCKFRYYISNILKLEKYEETFPMFIGSMFHYILSICFNNDFNFELEIENYLKDKDLSNKEKFFLNKLKEELLFIIDTLKYQLDLSNLKKTLYEKKIYINKDKNIKITFMGIVDKIMYKEKDNETLVAIIDYKTGHPQTNLNNTVYGIEMQLPVYMYLIKQSNLFSNVKFAGFYLQKILNNDTIIKLGDDIQKIKRDSLKLSGYSIDNEEILKEFDFTYKDSEVIKSMKVGNNGFYKYSKVISSNQIDKLTKIVDKKIEEASDEILSGNFDINPKRIGMQNVGCEFCNFKDLCFMTEKDIVNLKEYKNLEFLGSEE